MKITTQPTLYSSIEVYYLGKTARRKLARIRVKSLSGSRIYPYDDQLSEQDNYISSVNAFVAEFFIGDVTLVGSLLPSRKKKISVLPAAVFSLLNKDSLEFYSRNEIGQLSQSLQ